ncbi:MAG: SDR family NAD(P)-dependent oxidoreductase [Rhodothermales bacterium]|nr:SDR family NAD(P)-dependent oxidoreductase [Rhodothermales bacterium]
MYSGTEIAIVGLSGRFPGAGNVAEYWSNLAAGKESIRFYDREHLLSVGVEPETLDDPDYVPANGALADIDMFDADFFGFSPRDAAIMDPQHRLFLECAWEALEDSGYNPDKYDASIGVFAGSGMTAYMMYHLVTNPKLMNSVGEFLLRHTGNDKDFLTTRVSYNFNLRGPSINVQTACSTSLVATHLAAQNLLNGECDIALAGGVTILLQQDRGYVYEAGEILSPDGHCRPFDVNSQGTVFGSGCGVVVLKRLEDAISDRDTIHAVIKGSAINNDGSLKVSYLAPSVDGQAQVVAEALAIAELDPTDITYIEAHGTGTPVGDPIEVTALKEVYGTGPEKHCAIGSVKSNIGHLDTAAGVASLIKVVGALKQRAIPPTLHFTEPNPKLGLDSSPFYIADSQVDWKGANGIRRAGISSLGVGGTNAHLIVEEAPEHKASHASHPYYLLPLSARTEGALDAMTLRLADHLEANASASIADVAYTLSLGREEFSHRRVLAAPDAKSVVDILRNPPRGAVFSGEAATSRSQVIFMFAGGGAQYSGMGRDLYEKEVAYREAFDDCARILESHHGIDLVDGIINATISSDELARPSLALPALFATEYSVAQLLISRGIVPAGMTGHSMGEYTAACLAGVMSVADALALVVERGRLFETLESGGMLSVDLPEDLLQKYLPKSLSIAAVNAPGLCVASGPTQSIDDLQAALEADDIDCRRIKIDVAAHSSMVEPILDAFRSTIGGIDLHEPTIPFISNVTGTWITPAEATDPEYWVGHIRNTVRFADGITVLLNSTENVFLEVGPGRTLSSLVRMHPEFDNPARALSTLRHPQEDFDDVAFLLSSIGQLWIAGVELDWKLFFVNDEPGRIPLPTYPFERSRHWIDAGKAIYEESSSSDDDSLTLSKMPDISDWLYAPSFADVDISPQPDAAGKWLVFADDSEFCSTLVNELKSRSGTVTRVVRETSSPASEDTVIVDEASESAIPDLLRSLVESRSFPDRIVYAWSGSSNGHNTATRTSFTNLLRIVQHIAEEDLKVDLTVVSRNLYDDSPVRETTLQALSLGPVLVAPNEIEGISTRLIDASLDDASQVLRVIDCILSGQDNKVWQVDTDSVRVERMERTTLPSAEEVPLLRTGGVYLVTGGLGGIGSEIASFLASEYDARLVLTGRSDLPDRETWSDVAASNSPKAQRIRKLIELENSGAEVLYLKADVRRESDMARVAGSVAETFGKLDGIVHAAGVLRDNLIQLKTEEEALRVLGPKVSGTLAIEQAFDFNELDFVLLFSSTSSRLGLPGQVDYASANAFLNSFARYASNSYDTYCCALNWGMWSETGMTASGQDSASRPSGIESSVDHPIFTSQFESDDRVSGFAVDVNKKTDWFFTEHRVRDLGAVLPGTMYVELALAAAEELFGHRSVRVRNLFFLAPCTLGSFDTGRIYVSLDQISSGYRFSISSMAGGRGSLHASGVVESHEDVPVAEATVEQLIARCSSSTREINRTGRLKQEDVLEFGPRWRNIETIHVGDHEALARLDLSEEYRSDLQSYKFHPALLDMATGFALLLIDGFENSTGVYAPLSYKDICVKAPIPASLYSYAKYNGNGSGSVVAPFDITLFNEDGDVVAVIKEFVMRRTQGNQLALIDTDGGDLKQREETEPELVVIGREHGIRPDDGIDIVKRILAAATSPELVATSLDYAELAEFIAHLGDGAPGGNSNVVDSDYVEPRDDVERALCHFWEDLLGIEKIGIDQDFFAAGGHSLIAVRLFTRIRKKFGVELSLASLFTAPTIRESANLLRQELNLPDVLVSVDTGAGRSGGDDSQNDTTTSPEARQNGHQALVPIRKVGDLPTFFCVHGAGGNVINFWDISRHLGDNQPFYGLQMRGVDGKHQPPSSIEEMATEYIAAIKQHQPEGPYCIGGYSGGGVVAYEMARQLKGSGDKVDLLVFFDTFCPTLPARPGKATSQKVAGHLDGLKENGLKYLKGFVIDRYRFERNRLRKKMINLYSRVGLRLPIELREIVLVEAYHRAQDRYELKPYEGSLTLFTASIRGHAFAHVDDYLGWNAIDGLNIDLVRIPGDHDTLVLEPNVNILSSQLQQRLQAVHDRDRVKLKSAV